MKLNEFYLRLVESVFEQDIDRTSCVNKYSGHLIIGDNGMNHQCISVRSRYPYQILRSKVDPSSYSFPASDFNSIILQFSTISLPGSVGVSVCYSSLDHINRTSMGKVILGSSLLSVLTPPR